MRHLAWRIIRKKTYIVAAGLITIVGIAGGLAATVLAQSNSNTGIAITPPLFELSANPGDTLKQSIRVDNLTDSSLALGVDRRDFVSLGEEGQAGLTDKPTPYSLSSWIKPEMDTFEIPAKGSQTINFQIAVPDKAEPGGHFGSIVFRTIPHPDGKNTVISQELGALILLKVAGQINEKASIASFTSAQTFWESGPVAFETRLKNEGNVQIKPTGTVTVTDIVGRKIGSVDIDSRTVLPDSIRKINGSWSASAWPGVYTATVAVYYGSNNQLLTSSTQFVIFPYKIIIPILIVLIGVIAVVYRGRKRLMRTIRVLFGKD